MSETTNQATADIKAILAQREELKKRDPEAILFFRDGPWVRCYAEDAETLSAREIYPWPTSDFHPAYPASELVGPNRSVLEFAFPASILEQVLTQLVKVGRRAAVCEQAKGQSPAGAKIERVAMPGKSEAEAMMAEASTLAEIQAGKREKGVEHPDDVRTVLAWRDEIKKRRGPEEILFFHFAGRYRVFVGDADALREVIADDMPGVEFHLHGRGVEHPDGHAGNWAAVHPHALDAVLARIKDAGKRATVYETAWLEWARSVALPLAAREVPGEPDAADLPRRRPFYVGAQNDGLYIIDQPPRPSTDDPHHERDVRVVAKVYRQPDEDEVARLLAASPDFEEAAAYFAGLAFRLGVELPPDLVAWCMSILAGKERDGLTVLRDAVAKRIGQV